MLDACQDPLTAQASPKALARQGTENNRLSSVQGMVLIEVCSRTSLTVDSIQLSYVKPRMASSIGQFPNNSLDDVRYIFMHVDGQ